jgi:hypothetical protein
MYAEARLLSLQTDWRILVIFCVDVAVQLLLRLGARHMRTFMMKPLLSALSLSLLTGLAVVSSACSSSSDDVADQDDALGDPHSASERKSLAKLLASGELSGVTLDTFLSEADGVHIVHHLDEVKTVASTYAGAPAGEEPALDRLRSNIEGGVAGTVSDLPALPAYSCETAGYGSPAPLDAQGIYLIPIDGAKFDLLTRTILDAAEATGHDGTDLGLRFATLEKKIAYAALLPAKNTVLFFGRGTLTEGNRKKKVWRLYAADITTPACNATPASAALPHGTIDGKPFSPTSGTAFAAEGKTHLVFSTEPETCGMVQFTRVAAGATYVQLFGLGNEPGTYVSDDTKIARIDATCASGAEPAVGYSVRQVENGTVVTLTRVDDVVEGSVSAKFEDGSTFEGSFSVPRCAGLGTAEPTCK